MIITDIFLHVFIFIMNFRRGKRAWRSAGRWSSPPSWEPLLPGTPQRTPACQFMLSASSDTGQLVARKSSLWGNFVNKQNLLREWIRITSSKREKYQKSIVLKSILQKRFSLKSIWQEKYVERRRKIKNKRSKSNSYQVKFSWLDQTRLDKTRLDKTRLGIVLH